MSGAHLRPALRIELRGSPYRPEHAPIPGCPECQKVHRRLILIAQAVIPEDLGDWEVRMEPFDGVLTLMPGRGRLDVTLTLSLLPRGPWQDSHPESVACLREIESKLELLGAFKSH